METSRLFLPAVAPHSAGDFYALVSGEALEQRGAPARVAWEIERLAAQRGWPAGESLGSEAELRRWFGVSRETLREAIRIGESRGAMRMKRGRSGGLILSRPTIEQTAASLAAYMRATGISSTEFERSVRGFDMLLAWQLVRGPKELPARRINESPRHWLARASGRTTYLIYLAALDELAPHMTGRAGIPKELGEVIAKRDPRAIMELLSKLPFVSSRAHAEESSCPDNSARAAAIAVAMAERGVSGGAVDLGNEAALCEDFDTSRPILRQALRILQDLDLIQVRLGRGGGYTLKPPSPIGIIRQMFVWLAARNCCPFSLNELMWDLNSANLRIAGEQLAAMTQAERHSHCDRLDRILKESPPGAKFIALQQGLAAIARCPVVDTLARCIVSYQARSYGDLPMQGPVPAFKSMQSAIVEALRACDIDKGERTLRRLQNRFEEAAMKNAGFLTAAE